jgi:hypothetical protein
MIDRRWVRNIEWSDWSLLEDFELGGALVLVVSYYKEPTELSLAVAQPLHGWGVSGIARLRGWQQGWSSVPEGRVFYGRVPADIVEVALAGPRLRARAGVRPLGVWVGLVPGRRHVKRLHFLNAAGEVVRSLDHLDNCSFRFGRVGRWYWEQYRRVRMRGRTDRNIDLIADWGARLTAP